MARKRRPPGQPALSLSKACPERSRGGNSPTFATSLFLRLTWVTMNLNSLAEGVCPTAGGARTIFLMSWIGWALLSAAFAAATALLAKVGVAHVDSNLAMALRTTVVLLFAWGIVFVLAKPGAGGLAEIRALDGRTCLFLALSGLA